MTLTGVTPSFTAPSELLADEELVFTLTVTDESGIPSVNDGYQYGDHHRDRRPQ